MIAIIDYGMGNLRSVQKAFEHIGAEAIITQKPEEIKRADKIVLPGVGAFKVAMDKLESLNLVSLLKDILKSGKPYLGICLGLQLLFEESEEGGSAVKGLGVFAGRVKRFTPLEKSTKGKCAGSGFSNEVKESSLTGLKVPHMGWNQIKKVDKADKLKILKGIPDNSFMYFCHSYFVLPEQKDIISTYTQYGQDFVSMINSDNIIGVQFHPEKSQVLGLRILENFVRM